MSKGTVCVTGAGGFIGSWLVKLLLLKGYIVHGTVRDPADKKLVHFNTFENASNLRLFKADVLDLESLRSAIEGCDGVIHVASPIRFSSSNPEVEVIGPAVNGTRNVLEACSEAKVKRVVYVSSLGAILYNPGWPDDKMMDEDCWSDKEFCRQNQSWYVLAKTEAESLALDYGKKNGLDVVSVCPGAVVGPFLLHPVQGYNRILIDFVRGEKTVFGIFTDNLNLVDIRDTAAAILLAYEKPEARGRYICKAHGIKVRDLKELLQTMYPELTYYEHFEDQKERTVSSKKLEALGWTYRPLEETLRDSIENYRAIGEL